VVSLTGWWRLGFYRAIGGRPVVPVVAPSRGVVVGERGRVTASWAAVVIVTVSSRHVGLTTSGHDGRREEAGLIASVCGRGCLALDVFVSVVPTVDASEGVLSARALAGHVGSR